MRPDSSASIDPWADITALRKTRLLIVGDVMLDRYWFGEVERISPKRRCRWCGSRPPRSAGRRRQCRPQHHGAGRTRRASELVGNDEPGRALAGLLRHPR